jgi:hypothetical protein
MQQSRPENETCRLLGAARDKHSMRAAAGVNRPQWSPGYDSQDAESPQHYGVVEKANCKT